MDRRRLNSDTEVTKQNPFDAHAQDESTSLQTGTRGGYPQRSPGRRQQYRPAYTYDPFRCSYCNSPRTLTAFANVYATGSSLSKYRKGLVIKTGWAETRKQSVLAMQCAPPKKRHLWWPILLVLVGLGAAQVVNMSPLLTPYVAQLDTISDCLIVAGSTAGIVAFLWNRIYYPKKMQTWDNSFYCKRCSRVTILTPQQG